MITEYATYCPEDNKLRLYVGRVPRADYERLRAEGWTSTPKQGCDFVSTWTPTRRDTALEFCGLIEDEDQSPEDRAADRAERFDGYLDKRLDEAGGHADNYDGRPLAHGFQSAARAERAAARHDRVAARACDAWSKAEYWQRRTAGVISHALYVCRPDVRMGRIKTLEAELRKVRESLSKHAKRYEAWQDIASMAEPTKQTQLAYAYAGASCEYQDYQHPRDPERKGSIWDLMRPEKADPLNGAEAAALWLANNSAPKEDTEWTRHLSLRLAYENQMLEAQGGRLASVEIEAGGMIGGKLIVKVNKSTVTGRVTSVDLKGPKVQGWQYRTTNVPGADYSLHQFETERMPMSAYTPPTEETLAELAALKAEKKANAPTKAPCPLINPTDADAERLQAMWNERAKAEHEAKRSYSAFEPAPVVRITQARYSAASKGSYASCDTRGLCAGAMLKRRFSNLYSTEGHAYDKKIGAALCQIRRTTGGKSCGWSFDSVIILTDKPQKPLPSAVWEAFTPEAEAVKDSSLKGRDARGLSYSVNG